MTEWLSKDTKQNQQREEAQGIHLQASKSPLPGESYRRDWLFQPWVVTTHIKCCLPGELLRDSAPRVFPGNWTCRPPLPGIYWMPKFKTSGWKAGVWDKPYCLGTVSHSHQAMVGTPPLKMKSNLPDTSQGQTCRQVFLKIASRASYLFWYALSVNAHSKSWNLHPKHSPSIHRVTTQLMSIYCVLAIFPLQIYYICMCAYGLLWLLGFYISLYGMLVPPYCSSV